MSEAFSFLDPQIKMVETADKTKGKSGLLREDKEKMVILLKDSYKTKIQKFKPSFIFEIILTKMPLLVSCNFFNDNFG